MKIRVTLVAEPDGDRFHAYCAELTGIHADGDTEEDAFLRIKQAIKTHLGAMEHYEIPLPPGVMDAPSGGQPARRSCDFEVRAD